jgi:hypothetical protein
MPAGRQAGRVHDGWPLKNSMSCPVKIRIFIFRGVIEKELSAIARG